MNKIISPTKLKLRDTAKPPAAGKVVGDLQSALVKLGLEIKPSDLARKEMGASTVAAVRAFQSRVGLPPDGKLTPETVARLNADLGHNSVVQSKTHTKLLQDFAPAGWKNSPSSCGMLRRSRAEVMFRLRRATATGRRSRVLRPTTTASCWRSRRQQP